MIRAAPLLLAAGLAGLLAAELVAPGPEPAAPAAAARAAAPGDVAAVKDAEGIMLGEAVRTILARPLFDPSRRPPAVAAPAGPGARTELPRLAGVIVTPQGRRAIFAPAAGAPIAAAEGAAIGPWVVTSITAHAVTLRGRDGERVLRPSYAAPAGQAARP